MSLRALTELRGHDADGRVQSTERYPDPDAFNDERVRWTPEAWEAYVAEERAHRIRVEHTCQLCGIVTPDVPIYVLCSECSERERRRMLYGRWDER